MNSPDTVNRWLAELGERSGQELQLTETGVCAFRYADKLVCYIESSPETTQFHMFVSVLSIKEKTDDEVTQVLETCMKYNFFNEKTRGAVLGLDEENERILLTYSEDVSALDFQAFVNLLSAFLETADVLQNDLGSSDSSEEDNPPQTQFGSGMPFPGGPGMHV